MIWRGMAEIGSVLMVVGAWGAAASAYPALPARIPIHFGFDGRPDGWGPKRMIWLLPAISLGMYVFLTATTLRAGRDVPSPAFLALLAWLRFEVLAMFLYIETRTIVVAHGRASGLSAAFLPVTLAIILTTALLLTAAAPRTKHEGRTAARIGEGHRHRRGEFVPREEGRWLGTTTTW